MADQEISRKLAVIVHADVVGSTALVQRDETLAHQRINAAFQRFSSIIQAYNGTVHEIRGDALVAEFARASDAVCAALSFQQSNTEHNAKLGDDIVPVVRIGIALGEEVFADDTVTGAGVVLAQRVEQLAKPGGVCVTGAIHEAIPQRMPFDQESLGEQAVKGFDEPVRVYRVVLKPGAAVPAAETSTQAQSPSQTRRLIVAFAAVALIVVGGVAVWLKPWTPEFEPASQERMAFPLPDKPSIAVLPFDNLSGDQEQEYFSDGMTNDIITDLSKFKNLFVIASKSTFSYKGKAVKVQQVAEELGVRYVLEGSIQRTGQRLRINAQLIDATTGRHLWAERYDRNAADFFAIQEEIVRTIVATLAFQVTEAEIERAVRKGTDNLKAYDYYQRGWRAYLGFTKEANNRARELFEKAIELDPNYARAYSLLTWVHVNNSKGRYSWGEDPEHSLDLALEVARKAIALDPDDYYSHWALGFADLYHREFDRALAEYERALALNPNDATVLVEMVDLLVAIGRAEQAIAQVKTAMRVNPHHPDWYFWDLGYAQYFAEQYDDALATLNRMSNPPNGVRRTLAPVLVRLGRLQEARAVMAKFIETDLDMTLEEIKGQPWKHREYRDRWIDDLRTAGLPERRPLPLPGKPSIAVLPFANMSDDPKQEYFVDGMTEDLITDLSKIAGLFVIARNSTFVYKGKSPDIRQVARELGVRYVLEGSVRRSADDVRINAQLIDATSGGHVWAERYDGSLDNVFAMQDKVTQRIVKALAVELTPQEAQRVGRSGTNNAAAHEAYLLGLSYYYRRTPKDNAKAAAHFEEAIKRDPSYSDAYTALAKVYVQAVFRDVTYARELGIYWRTAYPKALRLLAQGMAQPNADFHVLRSWLASNKRQHGRAIAEAERALELSPNDADALEAMARALIFSGRPKEGIEFAQRAMRQNPTLLGRPLYLMGLAEFALGNPDKAVELLERATTLAPDQTDFAGILAAVYGELGRTEQAKTAYETWGLGFVGRNPNVAWSMAMHPFSHASVLERLANGFKVAGARWVGGYLPLHTKNRLGGSEIKSLLFGRKIRGNDFWNRNSWRQQRTADGTVEHAGFAIHVYLSGGDRTDTGVGRIENDMLCEQWPALTTAFEVCVVIFRIPEGGARDWWGGDYVMVTDTGPNPFSLVE